MVEKLPLSGFPPLQPQKFKERALRYESRGKFIFFEINFFVDKKVMWQVGNRLTTSYYLLFYV